MDESKVLPIWFEKLPYYKSKGFHFYANVHALSAGCLHTNAGCLKFARSCFKLVSGERGPSELEAL